MDAQFVDRLLTCSDCRAEFIFTAGEQVFFLDKQFKNDPKRCKSCKSRRSGLSSAAATGANPGTPGLARTETRTECSECRIETTVPFKPTQGRPVLCRQCFQMRNRAVAAQQAAAHHSTIPSPSNILSTVASADVTAAALTEASQSVNGDHLSPDLATLASASMAAASPDSSVSSIADLASICAPERSHGHAYAFAPGITMAATLLVDPAELFTGELLTASIAESVDA